MTIKELIEGMKIIAKYTKNGEAEYIAGADHDIIWAPLSGDAVISNEDKDSLLDLGWHVCSDNGMWACFC